jgi:hypothetical protein
MVDLSLMATHFFHLETFGAEYKWQLRLHVRIIGLTFLSITTLPAHINVFTLFSFFRTENIYFVLSALHIQPVVTSTDRKLRMPHIRGINSEVVVVYYELLITKERGYHRLS